MAGSIRRVAICNLPGRVSILSCSQPGTAASLTKHWFRRPKRWSRGGAGPAQFCLWIRTFGAEAVEAIMRDGKHECAAAPDFPRAQRPAWRFMNSMAVVGRLEVRASNGAEKSARLAHRQKQSRIGPAVVWMSASAIIRRRRPSIMPNNGLFVLQNHSRLRIIERCWSWYYRRVPTRADSGVEARLRRQTEARSPSPAWPTPTKIKLSPPSGSGQ